jgi:hypothetical protein
MLAGGTDPLYRSMLSAGHRHYVQVQVFSGDGTLLGSLIPAPLQGDPEGGLVFLNGSVTANLASMVARNVSLSLPMDLYPSSPTDLLAPFGNELRIFAGIRAGDGSTSYTWQVFRGRIQEVQQISDGTCLLTAADRATDVADVNFVSPQNSNPANTINAEWLRLIVDAIPDATFGTSDVFGKLVQPLTWQFERASALDEMARSVGALWYTLANGDFVLRRFPWAVNTLPVLTMTDLPGGTVNSWARRRARGSIFNVVTVTGERLNGDAPVFATASDTQVGSPTSTLGNFGVRSHLERLQTPSSTGGAQGVAEALLRTYIAPTEEWTMGAVPDAALELGDVLTLDINSSQVIQVVTGFTLPLGLEGDMTISTRSLVVGGGPLA